MVTHLLTRWSYGNAFHYRFSMLKWEKMYGNTCGKAYGNDLKLWYALHDGLSMFMEFGNVW